MGGYVSSQISEASRERKAVLLIKNADIKQIPKRVNSLGFLKRLDLQHNRLKGIIALDKLENLEELILSFNQIAQIPKELTFIHRLKKVDLSFNEIREIPSFLAELTFLESLNLASNQLYEINTFALNQMKNLQELDLKNNFISSLDELSLRTLQILRICYNRISILPTNLINLTCLQARGNKIQAIPDGITRLVELRTLDLNRNQIEEFQVELLQQLPLLNTLYLNCNQITGNLDLTNMKGLHELFLRKNNLTSIPKLPTFLNSLDISVNPIVIDRNDFQATLANLELLIIHDGQMAELSSKTKVFYTKTKDSQSDQLAHAQRIKNLHPGNNWEIELVRDVLKEIHEIVPNLFLSSRAGSCDFGRLLHLEITHVLTVAEEICPSFPAEFYTHSIKIGDNAFTSMISKHFYESTKFISNARKKGGVLVHCASGVSRSVSIVVAYLIAEEQHNLESGLELIRSKRFVAKPNWGFMEQLKSWESKVNKANKNN